MSDQTIPDSGGDSIKNVVPASWTKEECPPEWAQQTILTFDAEALQFSDSAVLAFKEY